MLFSGDNVFLHEGAFDAFKEDRMLDIGDRQSAGDFACPAEESQRQPSLTYAIKPHSMATYDVKIDVGNGAERIRVHSNTRSRQSRGGGSVGTCGVENMARSSSLAVGNLTTQREPLLQSSISAFARFELSPEGKVSNASGESQLRLLLGDYAQFAIWPLPPTGQTSWQVTAPLMVQQITRDQRFSQMSTPLGSSFLDNQRTSAAIETTKYQLTNTQTLFRRLHSSTN